jgi:hypothetical protein
LVEYDANIRNIAMIQLFNQEGPPDGYCIISSICAIGPGNRKNVVNKRLIILQSIVMVLLQVVIGDGKMHLTNQMEWISLSSC